MAVIASDLMACKIESYILLSRNRHAFHDILEQGDLSLNPIFCRRNRIRKRLILITVYACDHSNGVHSIAIGSIGRGCQAIIIVICIYKYRPIVLSLRLNAPIYGVRNFKLCIGKTNPVGLDAIVSIVSGNRACKTCLGIRTVRFKHGGRVRYRALSEFSASTLSKAVQDADFCITADHRILNGDVFHHQLATIIGDSNGYDARTSRLVIHIQRVDIDLGVAKH